MPYEYGNLTYSIIIARDVSIRYVGTRLRVLYPRTVRYSTLDSRRRDDDTRLLPAIRSLAE